MARFKRKASKKTKTVNEIVYYLCTGEFPEGEQKLSLKEMLNLKKEKITESHWLRFKNEIMKDWIQKYPGSRPWAWWKFESPKEKRRRVDGTGDAQTDIFKSYLKSGQVLKIKDNFPFGVPELWFQEHHKKMYPKREFEVLDKDDPPTFEGQAEYLKRHGLMSKSEIKRVPSDAYASESVLLYIW